MGNTYEPGHSRWTGVTGWLTVGCALAAILCALLSVSAYPPLTAELCFAGASAVFAGCWVVASYRARVGPLDKPRPLPGRRPTDRVLNWLFAFGVPFAVAAAWMVGATGSSADGMERDRLERIGYERREVEIVRPVGDPSYTPGNEGPGSWTADLLVRVPFTTGPRELVLEGYTSSQRPAQGMRVDAYYAPGHPEEGASEYWELELGLAFGYFMAAIFVLPFLIGAGAWIKSETFDFQMESLRRFRPVLHLPVLGILLCGLVLLLPVALEFEVSGYDRLPAFLAGLTPLLALAWVVREN
ncbi:hypothetical protein ACFRJ1_27770 [Streptomyces sp. NPDC056773]|uniref:hypothetical protein n=1 Tax=unclassified Streptomyces TaxID=2593676 RepID=UPI0036C43AC5